jgi:hypothetical protein
MGQYEGSNVATGSQTPEGVTSQTTGEGGDTGGMAGDTGNTSDNQNG